MSATDDLNLLMVHADDHEPVLRDGLPDSTARSQGAVEAGPSADHLWDEGGDPNDLALQRWGVIAPQGPTGDRLLAIVRPLIALREQQQGAPARIYRVPAQMTHAEAMRWKKREFDSGADFSLEVPRYQLVLGDLDQVPLALQQVQASDGYVGRLAFAREDDYAAYVDKALRWDRRARPDATGGRSLFFTVHDGTSATSVGHAALIGPGVALARKRQSTGQYPAREVVEFGDRFAPSPDELLTRARDPEPGVLFTLSHGEGAPRAGWRSPEEQRRFQGAMSFAREGRIAAEDLRDRTFMPGGVWFMLACYGAGTPAASAYHHWLAALAAAGQFRGSVEGVLAGLPGPRERPFVAALPQAALAAADGPLAFVGHVDLAWTYGFRDLDDGATNRPARFLSLTRALLKRDRVGVALRELTRFFDQTNIELTSLYDQEAQARAMGLPFQLDAARTGHLWMLRNDLAAYVLLGDPAARLPSDAASTVEATPPADAATAFFGPAGAAARSLAGADRDALEEALARAVLADLGLRRVAARLGIDRAELDRLVARYQAAGRDAIEMLGRK